MNPESCYLLQDICHLCISLACCVVQLAHDVMKYHERQHQLQHVKTVRIANTIASLVREFWTRMTEASCTV